MTSVNLYLLAGVILFCLGAVYLVIHPLLVGKVLAINVAGSGIFLVFIAAAQRVRDASPDPVPHAMVLTGIVVAVSATAVGLVLVTQSQLNKRHDNSGVDQN